MGTLFWGIFLLSSGLFLVLKVFRNWDIPTGRVLIALFLICLGLSILFGEYGEREGNRFLFREDGRIVCTAERDYPIVS